MIHTPQRLRRKAIHWAGFRVARATSLSRLRSTSDGRSFSNTTRDQAELIEVLRTRDNAGRLRLVEMFIGALKVKSDRENPDGRAQSAQSMRELLDKLTLEIDGAVLRAELPDISSQLSRIIDAYAAARDSSKAYDRTTQVWRGEIDTPFRNVIRQIEAAIDFKKQFISKKERSRKFFKTLPLGQAADTEKQAAFAKRWSELDIFFQNVAHHRHFPDESTFDSRFDECTAMLLDHLRPPVSDVLNALDRIVEEAERND